MKSSLFKNQYIVSIIKKGSTILFGFIATAFLSRAMGPSVKGEYDLYMNVISILNIVLYLGISTIYPNYVRKRENWTESTFVVFSLIQFLTYSVITAVLFAITRNHIIALVAFCVACSVLTMQLNNISLVENYFWNAVANIVSVVINAVLAILVLLLKMGKVEVVMAVFCVKELTLSIVAILALSRRIKFRNAEFSKMWGMIKRGVVPMIASLLVVVNYKVDVVFLKAFKISFYEIGLYTAGLGIAEYAWIIPDVFKDVLINKTARSDDLRSVTFCLRISSTFLLFAYIVLIVAGKLAIRILYGAEFLGAYPVTIIVFAGVYSMVYCKLLGTLYLAQGKWNFYCLVLLGAVAINMLSNAVFIPLMGIFGAAITTIVAYSFAGAFFLFSFKRKYRFKLRELLFIQSGDIKTVTSFVRSKIGKKKGETPPEEMDENNTSEQPEEITWVRENEEDRCK